MNISHNDNPDNRIDKLDMISTTKRRPTKKEYYTNERNELIDTLNKIIGISDKNNYVYLYDLQKNQELKDYIDDNIIQIRKIFKTHSWGYFSNELSRGKDNSLSLIKAIYKDNDYVISSTSKIIKRDNNKIKSVVYHFNKSLETI